MFTDFGGLTDDAEKVLTRAREIALSAQQQLVGSEHILLSLLKGAGAATSILNSFAIRYSDVMCDLEVLSTDVAPELERLWSDEVVEGELDLGTRLVFEVSSRDRCRAVVVERICSLIACELRRQGLSGSSSSFLVEHGEAVQATINDPDLARIPTQYE